MRRTRQAREATSTDRTRSLELLVAALLRPQSTQHVPIATQRQPIAGEANRDDGRGTRESS